jgi:hypothetical protein
MNQSEKQGLLSCADQETSPSKDIHYSSDISRRWEKINNGWNAMIKRDIKK